MDQLEKIECNFHDDEKVEFLCLNEFCMASRLFCFKCDDHSHKQDCNKIDRNLVPLLRECQIKKNELQNCIKQYQLKINQQCEMLLKSINLKYNISVKMLNLMTTLQDKNEAINELVNLKYEKKELLHSFQQKAYSLLNEIDFLKQGLKLEQYNYTKKVDVSQKQSIFLFQQASCIYRDQEDEALKLIKEALKFDSNNLEALNLQSQILLNKQKINEAEQLIEQSFRIDPYKLESILLKIKISPQNLNTVNKIINHYDKIAKYHSENDQILFEKANSLFNKGFYEESLNYFSQLISKDFINLDKIYAKGQEIRKQGKLEEAIQWFEQILKFDSKYFNAIDSKGEILLSQNKNIDALNFYNQQLQYFQNREELRIGKCEALFQLKKYKEAINLLSENPIKKYLPKAKKNCQDLIQKQSYADAILWNEAILLIDNTDQEFFIGCAQSLFQKGLLKQSEPWFELAQQLQTKNFSAYYDYIYTLFQINKFDEAFNIFSCMLLSNRQDPQKYLHIAEELFKKGKFEQSQKWFQKFMSLSISIPKDLVTDVFNYCQQLFKSEKYSESLKWAKLIAYSNTNYLKTFQTYAKYLEAKRLQQDAQEWYNFLQKQNPDNQKSHKAITKFGGGKK